MEVLPREILCIIFSYLDKQSVENAKGTCKLWFELIRNDKSLSGDICLEKLDLQELSQKILIGEWNWARWPALKTIKFGGLSATHIQPNTGGPLIEKTVLMEIRTIRGVFMV